MKRVFPELIGNEKLKMTLGNELSYGRHSHSYIIEGPDKSGRHTLARCISKALMCKGSSETMPCMSCKNCRNIDSGLMTDVYYLNKGDAATVSVDAVREMLRTLYYRPDDSDCKVYIVEDADKMTPSAQNALLLSLEEPPEFVVFILIVNNSSSLLETVRSRSTILKTEIFNTVFVFDWLKTTDIGKTETAERIGFAAAVSGGALGEAMDALSGDSKKLEMVESASQFVRHLCSSGRTDALMFAMSLKYTKEDLISLLEYTESALGDILSVKNGSENLNFYPSSEEALSFSTNIKIAKLNSLYESVIKAKSDITANVSPVVVLTTLAGSAK